MSFAHHKSTILDMMPWEVERRRSSMSAHSRRNSILSVSLFDFAFSPQHPSRPTIDSDSDPFAPLSIHEGISMTGIGRQQPNQSSEAIRFSPDYRSTYHPHLLSDRSESSAMSTPSPRYSMVGATPIAVHSRNTQIATLPGVHPEYKTSYSSPVKMSATLKPIITPDQSQKPPPFGSRSSYKKHSSAMISRLPLSNDDEDDDEDDEDDEDEEASHRFKAFHEEKWTFRYKELLEFHKENGHAAVPHTFPKNPQLARWVKRQRRQYKLRKDGRPSTMTTERLELLNSVSFIWDSHDVNWREKLDLLVEFRNVQGHCNVPSNFQDKRLATWIKCQRRQYKLYWDGKPSAMTPERIFELEKVGFEWEIRSTSLRRVSGKEARHQQLQQQQQQQHNGSFSSIGCSPESTSDGDL